METWHFVLIVALVAIVLYLAMRRTVLPKPVEPIALPIESAPGVSATTGQVVNNVAPPPPRQVTGAGGSVTSYVRAARPSNVLQNVPVIGNAAATVVRAPTRVAMAVTDKVNSSIEHIPIAGKALAAPGKAVTSAVKSITSWF
jgi:hypothetical protein